MTDVIREGSCHSCSSAADVTVIITATAVHPLCVLLKLLELAGNVLSVNPASLVGKISTLSLNKQPLVDINRC